jgi:5-methylcytosine-specific restriction endonuclease McrA
VKRCRACGEDKSTEEFPVLRSKGKQWLASYCRPCDADRLTRYRLAHPDRIKATMERHRAKNPLRTKIKDQQRAAKHRLKVYMGGGILNDVSYLRILARDGFVCHICKGEVVPEDLSFDHVIAVSKGGKHDDSNVKVAHFRCNSGKCDRPVEEYRPKFLATV